MDIFSLNGVLFQGAILATGIGGQIYVAHMNSRGFYLWMLNNLMLITVSISFGSYGMLGLYAFFLLMSGYSLTKWAEQRKIREAEQAKLAELLVIAQTFVNVNEHNLTSSDVVSSIKRAEEILMLEQLAKVKSATPSRRFPFSLRFSKA